MAVRLGGTVVMISRSTRGTPWSASAPALTWRAKMRMLTGSVGLSPATIDNAPGISSNGALPIKYDCANCTRPLVSTSTRSDDTSLGTERSVCSTNTSSPRLASCFVVVQLEASGVSANAAPNK
jgi:hypothetical protein